MPFRRIVAPLAFVLRLDGETIIALPPEPSPFDWPHEYAHALLPGLPEEFCEEAARKAKAVSDN